MLRKGETRYSSGTTTTDYQYTGQYSYAGDFGLLFYNARWYDPSLGRFAQADTIVPRNQGVQAWDRYAYGNNNPSRYTDPTGHTVDCGVGDDCEELHREVLRTKYDWFLKGRWDLQELDAIYGTGRAIESYTNEVTGGNGLDWMHYALGNTTIEHGYHVDGHSDAMPFFGKGFGARIRLDQNWITHHWGADIVFAHELGHVWDINSGFGASGKTNRDLGGSSWCFFCAPGDGVPPWARDYHLFNGDAYGNSGRNEYFAEAFSASIYNPTYTPTGVSQSINSQIQIDLVNYLFPGGIQ